MAPSATEIVIPVQDEISKQPEKHVHGAEDKTPLEAISHGPLIHPGKINVWLLLLIVALLSSRYVSGTPFWVKVAFQWQAALVAFLRISKSQFMLFHIWCQAKRAALLFFLRNYSSGLEAL